MWPFSTNRNTWIPAYSKFMLDIFYRIESKSWVLFSAIMSWLILFGKASRLLLSLFFWLICSPGNTCSSQAQHVVEDCIEPCQQTCFGCSKLLSLVLRKCCDLLTTYWEVLIWILFKHGTLFIYLTLYEVRLLDCVITRRETCSHE